MPGQGPRPSRGPLAGPMPRAPEADGGNHAGPSREPPLHAKVSGLRPYLLQIGQQPGQLVR